MKKLLCVILSLLCLLSLTGCVDHNDGVCDYKGCDITLGVIRYDKNHELFIKHAIDEGFNSD